MPPFWTEVWILGGGRSILNFDFNRIAGKTVLAVNDALFLPQLSLAAVVTVFSLDNNWIRRHRAYLETFPGEKYLALPLETWPDCADISGAVYLQWAHNNGLSEKSDTVATGCNSGYAAINLAYLKRAREIHLVGYDMNPADDEKFYTWAPHFRTMRPQLFHRAVEVLNHNPDSHIDAFQKVL